MQVPFLNRPYNPCACSHDLQVIDISLSPQDFHPFDSNKILSASLDHSVKIWDIQCGCAHSSRIH